MEKAELFSRVASVGLPEWGLYNVLLAESSPVTVNFTEYAALFGISVKTLRKYFAKLVTADLIRLDANVVNFTSETFFTTPYISYNVIKSIKDIKELEPVKNTVSTLAYWCAKFNDRYGVKYTASSWAREQRSVKLLDARYGSRIQPIIDVVMRLYETRWYSQSYPRPTLGAMVSWLAAQAEGFLVVMADPSEDGKPIIPDSTDCPLDAFDAKFGIGGVSVGD